MTDSGWKNPWKLTTVAMGLVVATALATGLVVANWTGKNSDNQTTDTAKDRPAPPVVSSQPAKPAPTPSTAAAVPAQSVIAACNQSAAAQSGQP